jgi:hypothetical protein
MTTPHHTQKFNNGRFGAPLWTQRLCSWLPALILAILLSPSGGWCNPQAQWGGYVRTIGTISWPDDQTIYQLSDEESPFYDGQLELRLNNQLFFGSHWSLETHYEAVLLAGDTLKADNQIKRSLPTGSADLFVGSTDVNDDRRLMDLTHTLDDGDGHLFYHRLDRLNLTWTDAWGTLRLGRQALTWGDGMFFNPMDLFNPFSPTTVNRDYKTGEDMAYLQLPLKSGDIQVLLVPRRDPVSDDVEEDQGSCAGKWHITRTPFEFDLMIGRHYGDSVFGAGVTGFLGGAAWRLNALYTDLDQTNRKDDLWQAVANIDYAWQWGGKNFYGLLEYYYNGLGRDSDYAQSLNDPDIVDRLTRGELFTLGNNYLAGQLEVQVHPLVQTGMAVIVNLGDGSGIFQPKLLWDINTDWQMILGANLYWGGSDTEYGGFETSVNLIPITVKPTDSVFLWLTYYY